MSTVQIELTNYCNSRCIFCPRNWVDQKVGTINRTVFELVLCHNADRYVISGFGEPLIHSRFIELINRIRERRPNSQISVFTNGSLITPKLVKEFKRIDGLDIIVSLNGPNEDVRFKLMGLDDFKYVHSIYYEMLNNKIDCSCSMVGHPIVKPEHYMKFLKLPNSVIIQFQSFGGLVYKYKGDPDRECSRKDNWLTYDWQGNRIKCCFDIEGLADCGQCTEGIQI